MNKVVQSSSENLNTSQTSISFPLTPSKNSMSPNVSPTVFCEGSSADLLTPTSPAENTRDTSEGISTENLDTCTTSALPEQTAGVEDSPFPRPLSINLIDFSPCEPSPPQDDLSRFSVSQNDKRKSSETETLDDNAIYQQVKYFRRSIHEVNALLDLDKTDTEVENKSTNKGDSISENTNQKLDSGDEEENFDSLEPQDVHVYENVEGESMRGDDSVYENVSFANKTEDSVVLDETTEVPKLEKVSVRDLTSKFEEIESVSLPVSVSRHCSDDLKKPSESVLVVIGSDNRVECLTNNIAPKPKKYEKDGLPPCLRARNLKHQLKTRSLDEEEFEKEFGRSLGNPPRTRRSSMDEMFSHKTNSLPKTLNQPKMLPADGDPKLESIHLAHSSENIGSAVEEEQKKRERIEKYKEERRKFLHDKYRSESFKEDKDVLKSRLKIFRTKEEMNEPKPQNNDFDRPPRTRTRSTRSEDDTNDNASENDVTSDSLEEQAPAKIQTPLSQPKKTDRVAPIEQRREPITKPMKDSLKSRAAIFEQQPMNQRISATQDQNRNNNHYRSSKQETEPHAKNLQDTKPKICTRPDRKRNDSDDDLKGADFMRIKNKDVDLRDERRRHTFETRERESETDKIRRISLETKKSPRREKTPASYCIKDMKAIFESKSKQ